MRRILYVYRGPRAAILADSKKRLVPDSMLFGLNHLRTFGYQVDFFDSAFSRWNLLHPVFFPFEQTIIREIGMGFKLDQATILLHKVNKYDVIVCTSDSAGLPFLLYKHVGMIKEPLIILGSGLPGALFVNQDSWVFRWYRKLFTSITVIAVYSRIEAQFYENILHVPKDKIHVIPYGTDWRYFSKKSRNRRSLISAVGVDSGRDYKTFFEAVRDFDLPVVVACHPDNVKGLTIPDNVSCEFLAGYQRVKEIFQTSKVVVVPCKERYRSAGQMVALEASSARAPLIVSAIKGMTTAFTLRHRQHLLYVPPEDPIKLQKAISYLLHHEQEAESMAIRASNFVENHYTSEHLAKNLSRLIASF